MRNRTRKLFSYGSTWMSDAFFLIADSRIALHSLTTGASPAWFSRSTTLTFSSATDGEVDVVDVELADHLVEVGALVVVAATARPRRRLSDATTGSMLYWVRNLSSSIA